MNIGSYTFQYCQVDKLFPQITHDQKLIDPGVMPDASINCDICRENIFGSHSVAVLHVSKKLPSCNPCYKNASGMHFFHANCINKWWEIQKGDACKLCPSCRSNPGLESYFSSVANAVELNQSPDVICELIDDGADCNAFHSSKKMAAIHIATKKESVDLIKTLLAKGASINIQDGDTNTTLYYAIETENLEILNILLANNPDINIQRGDGKTALHMAAEKPQCPELFSAIMAHNPNLELANQEGLRAIHYATESGHQTALEALIAKGVNVNAVDHDNRTALHYVSAFSFFSRVVKKNRTELAKALINAGARVDIVSGVGYTVFEDIDCSNEATTLATVMLPPAVENFEDVKKNFPKENLLFYASLTKDKEIIKKLIAKGARLDNEWLYEKDFNFLGDEKQKYLDLLKL